MSDSHTLIYEGALAPRTVDYLKGMMQKEYVFWVEFEKHPDDFNKWSESALDKAYIVQGNDIEGYSSGWRTQFCVVPRSRLGSKHDCVVFYGFKTKHERDLCANHYRDILISAEPFKTGF